MKINRYIAVLILSLCVACAANESKSAPSASGETMDTNQTMENESGVGQSSAGKEIKEKGLLKQAEDSGYPFMALTIEFPERKFEDFFSLNLEEAKGADLSTISTWVGKYISFTYTSDLSNNLLDLHQNGKSLLGADQADLPRGLKKIIGILQGADAETAGDLPGEVRITDTDNKTLSFPFYITKEMVAANGKTVTGLYDVRAANVITSIQLIPN